MALTALFSQAFRDILDDENIADELVFAPLAGAPVTLRCVVDWPEQSPAIDANQTARRRQRIPQVSVHTDDFKDAALTRGASTEIEGQKFFIADFTDKGDGETALQLTANKGGNNGTWR